MVPQVQGEGLPVFAWRGGRAADWLEITYPCPVGYDGQKQFSSRLRRGARWPKRTLREKTIPSVPPSGPGVRCPAGFAAPFALPVVFLMFCAVYMFFIMVIEGYGLPIGIVGTIVFSAMAIHLFRAGLTDGQWRVER